MEQLKKPIKQRFFRKTIKVGNSSGVLLPKTLLGSDVIVTVINRPFNIKKDVLLMLEPAIEDIIGVYLITSGNKKVEVLAVSSSTESLIEKGRYKISIVPIKLLEKSLKNKKPIQDKIKNAQPILNQHLLISLKKGIKS
ncbi:MAG: hypothetical protein WC533_01830 [Candidatus Pacearchaeota archaeon]